MSKFRRTQPLKDVFAGRSVQDRSRGVSPGVKVKELAIDSSSGGLITGSDGVVRQQVGNRRVSTEDTFLALGNLAVVGSGPPRARFIPSAGLEAATETKTILAVISHSGRLALYGTDEPSAPNLLGAIQHSDLVQAEYIAASGNYIFVPSLATEKIAVVDVSDPTAPVIVGSSPSGIFTTSNDGVVSGNRLYMANINPSKVSIVNISEPASPVLADTTSLSGFAGPGVVEVTGGYLYVFDVFGWSGGVFSLTDPSDSVLFSISPQFKEPKGMAVSGDYVYVGVYPPGTTSGRLNVVNRPLLPDFSAFSYPYTEVDNLEKVGFLHADGSRVFFHTDAKGFGVIDVSVAGSPVIKGSLLGDNRLDSGGHHARMAVIGDRVYVPCYGAGAVTIMNVSNLSFPSIEGSVPISSPHGALLMNVEVEV